MKTVGLLGGMTCESTLEYYRLINRITRREIGGSHSAKIVMISMDFHEIDTLMEARKWDEIASILSRAAINIERCGADFLVICTNTMHKIADEIQRHVKIPILNIIDATACEIKKTGIGIVGLLGTSFTMEEDFYKERLGDKYGLQVLTPDREDRNAINRVIKNELAIGEIRESSKRTFQRIIQTLKNRGAKGVVLGCTEIPVLVGREDADIPLFDTTYIHSEAAAKYAIGLQSECG
jgi:aspartate racemase